MKGAAIPLYHIWGNSRRQLVIPVYQRNYSWGLGNCNRLFEDLVKLKSGNRKKHFFGSIVTAPVGQGQDRLIIDGQQRLTTISLLILAAIKAVKDGKMNVSEELCIEDTCNEMLYSPYCSNITYKYKLKPIEQDRFAYERLFTLDCENFVKSSKITRNFNRLYDLLTLSPKQFSFNELLNIVNHLQVVCIELDTDDDPQLIFESLNSTGIALDEADKIRNYILMDISADEQETYFKKYWLKVQQATNDSPTIFLRDYLTISNNLSKPVKLDNLYSAWKNYMVQKDRMPQEELATMLEYVRYHRMIITAEITLFLKGKWVKKCHIK